MTDKERITQLEELVRGQKATLNGIAQLICEHAGQCGIAAHILEEMQRRGFAVEEEPAHQVVLRAMVPPSRQVH